MVTVPAMPTSSRVRGEEDLHEREAAFVGPRGGQMASERGHALHG
jgi:hypothetical protein